VTFDLEETGFLKPNVYGVDIDFGKSDFKNDDPWIAFFTQQWIEFMIVIIENTAYFVGTYMFSAMLGPIMTSLLNNYTVTLPFKDFLPGQESTADFTIDYRQTQRPDIYEGFMDFRFLGEFMYNGVGCELEHEPVDFYAQNAT
jgi:hypothetical protein